MMNRRKLQKFQRPQRVSFFQSFRRDGHYKCLVLSLLIFCCGGVILWCRIAEVTRLVVNFHNFPISSRRKVSPCDEGYVYIPIAFMLMLYLVYLVECWHCTTRLELTYKVNASDVYRHIERMQESQPLIWWKAICYHYVRRTRQVTRYRNGDAYTASQIYYERINSHAAASCFVYTHCGSRDISKKLVDLEKHPATKIRFSKGFAFASSDSANDFEEQRLRFFRDNERLDDYMEMREGLDFIGIDFQEYMVVFADKEQLPWYVSHAMFWTFSFLLMSWPLRVLIEFKTAYVHYQVTKLFGADMTPSTEARTLGSRMSRTSTVDSSEIERNIADSFTMAPSYSEAILFDTNRNLPVELSFFRDSGLQVDVTPLSACSRYSSQWVNDNQRSTERPTERRSLPPSVDYAHGIDMRRTSTCPRCYDSSRRDTPPSYEDALLVSRPLGFLTTLRRSMTDRDLTAFRSFPRLTIRRSCSRLCGWRKESMETAL